MYKLSPLSKVVKLALFSSLALSTVSTQTIAAESADDVERIAVVGSRAAPRSVDDSPVPIDIIGGDELGKNASTDMLDMLQAAVPSFTVKQQPISDAASFIRPVNLRGLSSDSTLILVNGKRRHRASVLAFQGGGINDGAQGPDISVIPSSALKQVEILRDGAAAQYGSDAIAGVLNFVLNDASEGGSLSVRQGEYYEGDGAATVIDGNIGLELTENGFANLSFQYKNADATSRTVQRNDAQNLIDAGNTSVNDPAMVWGNPEIKDDLSVFVNLGLELNDQASLYAFGNVSSRTATGGYYYRNPQNRGGVFTGDTNHLVGDLDGVGVGVECPSIAKTPTTTNILDDSNYQLIADPNTAVGQNCFAFNEILPGGYTPQFTGDIEDSSFVAGVKGEFKHGFLDEVMYDVSGSVGRNKSSYTLVNTVNPSFGPVQPAGLSFDTGSYIQLEKSFNVDLVKEIQLDGGQLVNVASGIEVRQESFEIVAGEEASWKAGPLASQGFSIGSHGFAGFHEDAAGTSTRDSFGAYLDVESQVTEQLLLGGALRYEDFSSFGDTTNYKLTAQYVLSDDISLRASHSTGFRAPTVGQDNVVNTQTSMVNGELIQSATYPPAHPVSMQKGATILDPEQSTSFAFGAIYNDGTFFVTADFYSIEVTDRIAQTDKLNIVESDWAPLTAAGVKNPELLGTITFFANDFDTTTTGLDIVANYSADLFGGDTDFALAYNWNETSVDSVATRLDPNTGAALVATSDFKISRLEDGIPKHRATFTISQKWEDVSTFIRANYYGEYLAVHADDPGVSETGDSAITIDAEMSYSVTEEFTVSVGANNIFDQEAHRMGYEGSQDYAGGIYYETSPFDFNGGSYYIQGRYSF